MLSFPATSVSVLCFDRHVLDIQARFLKVDIDQPSIEKTVVESNISSVVSHQFLWLLRGIPAFVDTNR